MMCHPHHFSYAVRAETPSYRSAKPSGLFVQDHQLVLTSRSTQRFPKVFRMRARQARQICSDGEECRRHPKYTLAMTRRMM